jgi:hypothetical protein
MTLSLIRQMTAGSGRRESMRGRVVAAVVGTAVLCAALGSGAGAAAASPSASRPGAAARIRWAKTEPLPGLAMLNKGHDAAVSYGSFQVSGVFASAPPSSAISCWGPGGCAAGGFYTDKSGHLQAWVAQERKGRWGRAEQVPGTAVLNKGGHAEVTAVSCARTSACVAVGGYTDQDGNGQWFTVNERNGRWATAAEVPYPALNDASIDSVWCAPGGLCADGGTFTDPSFGPEAWVQTEVHGRWQPALEVPGITKLDVSDSPFGDDVGVDAVSCASADNCAAGGQYSSSLSETDYGIPELQAFVVTETNGRWGDAQEVPGIEGINQGDPNANTTFMVCPSAGNCTASGYYETGPLGSCDPPSEQQPPARWDGLGPPPEWSCIGAFVVNERHGAWGQVTRSGLTYIFSLTCPAAGDCVAAGASVDYDENSTGVLESEVNDKWARALELTKTTAVYSVACASPGYCSAGGQNSASTAFVISEWHGTWGKAIGLAGIPAEYNPAEPGGASVSAVACPPSVTLCTAGGSATSPDSNRAQAFILSQVR